MQLDPHRRALAAYFLERSQARVNDSEQGKLGFDVRRTTSSIHKDRRTASTTAIAAAAAKMMAKMSAS
jgi:hypothetical protein